MGAIFAALSPKNYSDLLGNEPVHRDACMCMGVFGIFATVLS